MNRFLIPLCTVLCTLSLQAQETAENPFLVDFAPRTAEIVGKIDAEKTSEAATVSVSIDAADTVTAVSKYIFGNAVAAWVGDFNQPQPVLIDRLNQLAPALIRYPGGSWSDVFFWNGVKSNLPGRLIDGTSGQDYQFTPNLGTGSWEMTVGSYYQMREDVKDTQGLITINYGYARYGTGPDPVAEAAHLAADWVRYDNGRTLFWEIGNESAGPWEAGWQIDTTANQDGQPKIISGTLYGRHFNVFADSMKAAATEVGTTIYIGAQLIHFDAGPGHWNPPEITWNEGVFAETGDMPDFYVVHNYFGGGSPSPRTLLAQANVPAEMISFMRQDMTDHGVTPKPVALTEWNISAANDGNTSYIAGVQAVLVFSELIKNGYGMSARWHVAVDANNNTMFYHGSSQAIPDWNPYPDFFYVKYLQQFFGDHMVASSSTNDDIASYASRFSSGEVALVIVNKRSIDQVVEVNIENFMPGDRYLMYSLTGGTDSNFSQQVYVNEIRPDYDVGGPVNSIDSLEALSYSVDGGIRFECPGYSVQFVMIDKPGGVLAVDSEENTIARGFVLRENYPNPFNPDTDISFELFATAHVELSIFDLLGRKVVTLLDDVRGRGEYRTRWDARDGRGEVVSSGVYVYRMTVETNGERRTVSRKMLFLR